MSFLGNPRERAVAAAFRSAVAFDGFDAALERGAGRRRFRGFYLDGGTVAEIRGSTFRAAATRTFVVEKKALGPLFPPRPRDVVAVEENGETRRFETFATPNEPLWRYWSDDRRFVAIRLQEIDE